MPSTQVESGNILRSVFETVGYWFELALLTAFGPARLDDEHDPVAQLRAGRLRHRSAMHWVG